MNNIRIEVMVKYLRPQARWQDVGSFRRWEGGHITTAECIAEFRAHNEITERMPIPEDDFTEWLNSLGYRRYEDGTKQ